MAIRQSGEFSVPKKPQEVFDFLTDPQRFAPLLPDFEGLEVKDKENFVVKAKVGVSYIRGTATMKMKLAEASPPTRAVYQGSGNMAGGSVNMTAGFDLEEEAEGTRVKWQGEAQVFGKLASVAGGLLEPLAKKNMQKLIDSLQSALSS